MWKKLVQAVLVLCALLIGAGAAAQPKAPDWWIQEEYLVFEGDSAYQTDNWEKIERLRADAAAGHKRSTNDELYDLLTACEDKKSSPAMLYECALVELRYARTEQTSEGMERAGRSLLYAYQQVGEEHPQYPALQLLYYRVLYSGNGFTRDALMHNCKEYLRERNITQAQFLEWPFADIATEQAKSVFHERWNKIIVLLDGDNLETYALKCVPESKDGRTMLPMRALAEALGAVVSWDSETRTVSMERVGVTIQMTIGQKTAYRDKTALQMDVAPYISGGNTMLPARYVGEFFGQIVGWEEEYRVVTVNEDFSTVGNSNLSEWARPMGAMLSYINDGRHIRALTRFGSPRVRVGQVVRLKPINAPRVLLERTWSITSREDLISTIASMTPHGHNDSFLDAAEIVNGLSDAEYRALLDRSDETDRYMWPYTKALSEKWGDRGILAWDEFRMASLVQKGYEAGYLTYAEALAAVEPAARMVKANFKSWDEAYENYLDGYI